MRKKVLIVDDSETIRTLEHAALSRYYDVVAATDGGDAIEIALREHPDLILMDLLMPKMNGLDACRALKGLPETKDIPIIMITTASTQGHMRDAMQAGCLDYVLKPIVAIELTARVRALLGEHDPWGLGPESDPDEPED